MAQQLKKTLMILSGLLLTACGGSNEHSQGEFDAVSQVPTLNPIGQSLGSLAQSQGTRFERHLKNGVYLRGQGDFQTMLSDGQEYGASTSAQSYSSTTVQEQGVDEKDLIKYDGQHLFIGYYQHESSGENFAADNSQGHIAVRILSRDNQGKVSEVADVVVDESASNINGLYLSGDRLAVLSDIYQYQIAATSIAPFFPSDFAFNLALMDVSQPNLSNVIHAFTIDGAIVDSRRIGDMLYIVSSYRASMEDVTYAETAQEQLDNYNKIMQTDLAALLPKYTDAQGNEFSLVTEDNCYLPENITDKDGFDGIVTLTAIDITNPSAMHSVCINAQVQGVYASRQSLYLYGTEYDFIDNKSSETSVIHKFNIDGNRFDYRASGILDGRFNWQLSNLRFSERGDYLRVVTTSGSRSEGFVHRLNVLTEDGNELTVVSQLPNEINSQPIGKVDDNGLVYEDIEAVRFFNDQAYIVTFLNSDPLYVVDLKNNLAPKIAGALEIPGYSAYLQPISDNLLLGIGQNVEPGQLNNEETDTSSSSDDDNHSPIIEGAKVSLFNVSDLGAPQEIHSIVYQDAYTPVEFDYHALTWLKVAGDQTRFALPIERWLTETKVDDAGQKYNVWYTENKLALFDVSDEGSGASLNEVGYIQAIRQKDEPYNGAGWLDRSVFHGDDIYYIHHAKVWHALWSDLNQVTGPH